MIYNDAEVLEELRSLYAEFHYFGNEYGLLMLQEEIDRFRKRVDET